MSLTDVLVRNAKPKDRMYRLADGDGLHLQVEPNGTRAWRFRYRFNGRAKMVSFGVYPDVPLRIARDLRAQAREHVAAGRDPSALRSAQKQAQANTFEAVAREWYSAHVETWAPSHASKVLSRLEKDIFPYIGNEPIASIESPRLLEHLRRVERRGAADSARRIRRYCSGIFKYAIASGRASRDAAADLDHAIKIPTRRHYSSITDPKQLGALLVAIESYRGTRTVRCALALLPHVFVRPGELRSARWSEFDLDKAIWTIPPERRKVRFTSKASAEPHLVPLSQQVIRILRELPPPIRSDAFVFPNEVNRAAAMSDGALNKALRTIGFGDKIVAHGFRHAASTLLHEMGFDTQWIEKQLAHTDANVIRGTYNRAAHLPDRKRMMQKWSDQLDQWARAARKYV